MINFKEIINRIKDILSSDISDRKIYDKDVAQALNIKQITLATMKNRNKIPYKEILDFCAKKKVSINWLLYDQIVESLQKETEKFVKIKYFGDIYASAGGGALNYEEEYKHICIDKKMYKGFGDERELKYIESLNVIGDSMEPTLKNGNIIFINRSLKDIGRGGIFVVSTASGLFIKRVNLKTDGTVDLISDNSSYPVENISDGSVKILGKVVGVMSGL